VTTTSSSPLLFTLLPFSSLDTYFSHHIFFGLAMGRKRLNQ
jgi:hypothetical protein